jgi:hypothetical protein
MSEPKHDQKLEASFSTLVLSIGSTAAIALGMAPNPQTGKEEKDAQLARFNIDLLIMLQKKTKGNLEADEVKFLDQMVADLQMTYVKENVSK